jgi:hypothetical protein
MRRSGEMPSILRALVALITALVKDHGMLKVQYRGQAAWLHVPSLRAFPVMAGGEETPEEKAAAEKAAADKAAADAAAAKAAEEKAAADAAAAAKAKEDDEFDKDRAMATIRAQRDAEAKMKKERDDALAKLKKREDADLSEAERLKKEAEEGKALATSATEKLRKANLITALAGTDGVVDAKAAAKLIEGVEYDTDDEPTNLDARVKALLEEFPLLKGEATKPKPPGTNGNEGGGDDVKVDLTAEELAAAKETGMTAERYKQLKGVTNLAEFQELERKRKAAEAAAAAK